MEKKLSVSLTREEVRILGQWCQQQQAEAVFFCTVNMDMLPEGYAPRLMLGLKSYVLFPMRMSRASGMWALCSKRVYSASGSAATAWKRL